MRKHDVFGILAYTVVACILVCMVFFLFRCLSGSGGNRRVAALQIRLDEARREAEEAIVIRSVSRQMEEIAYQQKALSDMQRTKAERQAEENYRMKLRVEQEWKRAVEARREAELAYRMADSQKVLAEERRAQAEYAKRVADTLTYLTLGRSLASTASTLYRIGSPDTAALLAYASWHFVRSYGGDVFTSSVFQALSLVSGQPRLLHAHRGGVGALLWKSSSEFYSLGRYGEVVRWTAVPDSGFVPSVLMSDPRYDFRDACFQPAHGLCALSYGGEVLAFPGGRLLARVVSAAGCVRIMPAEDSLWVQSSQGTFYDAFSGERVRSSAVSCFPVESVTAMAHDSLSALTAWGCADGTVLLTDSRGRLCRTLVGHRSAVTGVAFFADRLCTCSHDRTLRLWNLRDGRSESVVALEAASWLLCLALSPDSSTLLTGDADGRIYSLSLSPDVLAAGLCRSFSRNLTFREWEDYIGKEIPYMTFTDKYR